jgi:hypothetical protein
LVHSLCCGYTDQGSLAASFQIFMLSRTAALSIHLDGPIYLATWQGLDVAVGGGGAMMSIAPPLPWGLALLGDEDPALLVPVWIDGIFAVAEMVR